MAPPTMEKKDLISASPASHIGLLSSELLANILEIVLSPGLPCDLLHVALVNSTWYRIARRISSSTITLDLYPSCLSFTESKLDYLEAAGILGAVHSLEVSNSAASVCDGEGTADSDSRSGLPSHLCSLIPRMMALREMHWGQGVIPHEVLAVLKARPEVRLHLDISRDEGQTIASIVSLLSALDENFNLHALRLTATLATNNDWQSIKRPLKRALFSSTYLRELTLNLKEHASIHPADHVDWNLELKRHEVLPKLKLMDISPGYYTSYVWTHGDMGKNPGQQGYISDAEEDLFPANVDWSSIRTLALPSQQYAKRWTSKMTGLRSISFYIDISFGRSKSFFEEVPSSLESISLPSAGGISERDIVRHGPTLTSLTFHQKSLKHEFYGDDMIDLKQLDAICNHCPLIESLTFDLRRIAGEMWPEEHLRKLARLPELTHLEVWLDIRKKNRRREYRMEPAQPIVRYSSVKYLLQLLLRHGARSLETLRIHSAIPPHKAVRMWPPEPVVDQSWRTAQNTTFVCIRKTSLPSETSRMSDAFYISCVGLDCDLIQALPTGNLPSRYHELSFTYEDGDAIHLGSTIDESAIAKHHAQRRLFELALSGAKPIERERSVSRALPG